MLRRLDAPAPGAPRLWRARKAKGALDCGTAAHACELPTWADRRALLGMVVGGLDARTGTALAARLTGEGETDAAAFVRQELLRNTSLGSLGYEELRTLLTDEKVEVKVARQLKDKDELPADLEN